MHAEGWLVREKDIMDTATRTGQRWKPPNERAAETKAEVVRLSDYGKTVIDQRVLRPRTRIEYESKWSQLIEPGLGDLAVRDLRRRRFVDGFRPWTRARQRAMVTRIRFST